MWDDFSYYTDANNNWTKAVGSGGGVAMTAGAGGLLQLTTGGTQNIFASIATTNAVFKFLAGRNWYVEALINYTEVATNQAAVAFGLSSVISTSLLTNSTGVPVNSFSGALLYKQTGDTYLRAITSNGTTQTLTASAQSTQPATAANYQLWRMEGRDVDGSNMEVTFFLNESPIMDQTFHRPIKQTVAISGAATMNLVLMLKNVGGANSEVLNVDYIYGAQRRPGPLNQTATSGPY